MSDNRVYELLSGLGVALGINGMRKRKPPKSERRLPDPAARTGSSSPQVMIYTRKPYSDYGMTCITDNVLSQLGYESQEFTENSSFWMKNVHPEDASAISAGFMNLLHSGHHAHEYRFLHKDGSYRWMRDDCLLIRDTEGNPSEIVGSWIDVTQRKRAEGALTRTVLRYRSLVDSSPVGMVSFDKRGEITEFNPAVMQILGAPFGEATDPKDLFTLLPVMEAGISEAILDCLESGQEGVGEFQYKSKNEKQVCTRLHVTPVRSGEGRVSGVHAFVQDISDQKRAEELIVRSERLKVLGQIARGLGYNFNNLLQVVSGNANMALTSLDLKDSEAVRNNLERILESAQSAAESVRWLHQFGRDTTHKTTSRKEVLDLSDAVDEAVEICKLWSRAELERTGIQVRYHVTLKPHCYVQGVPDQVSWVALNLLKNAVEAIPDGGRIKVRTFVKNNRAILNVQDNGVGIPPGGMDYMTQAFWTSKEAHAGMGLTFNSEIIRQHRGSMGVKRATPRGTCFVVRFPYVRDPMKQGQAQAEGPTKKGFHILLIEDEAPVLRIFDEGLTLLGQNPVCASSVKEGLRILQATEIDAIVCELAMPETNGWEAAAAVRRFYLEKDRPKPPVVILTGCAPCDDEDATDGHPGVDRVLGKPIKVSQLLEAITEEIGKSCASDVFSGKIDRIDLLEYVQLLLLNGHKAVLEILPRQGAKGLIFLDKGEIRHAMCGDLQGEEALYRCLSFKGGTFSNLPWVEPDAETVNKSAMFLLVEAARRRDEIRHSEPETPTWVDTTDGRPKNS